MLLMNNWEMQFFFSHYHSQVYWWSNA